MIALTLPYPPSVNQIWKRGQRGEVFLAPSAAGYKRTVRYMAKAARVQVFGKQRKVVVTVRLFRPQLSGDLDNRLKMLLDSLNGVAYIDDKQIVEIHAYRFDDKANPRAEVEIREKGE